MNDNGRIQKIRARHAACTGGEWLPCGHPAGVIASDLNGEEEPIFICDTRVPDGMLASKGSDADRKFIMNAPEDVGYLLSIIDSLLEKNTLG